MGADASTAPLGSSKSKKQVPIFHQILIVLHGSRKSGKTSLLRRMNGLNLLPQYTPTKCMQASEIIWHPICMPDESIKIIVWDVVDKAIDQTPQSQRTKQLPDATNVDTFSRADGIIVIYDPRDEDSIKYARSILDQAPQAKPTLIVMNFADSFEKAPSVPSLMEPYTNSFFHLTASMKTNQGLAEIANWLDLPMNVSLSKIYELHLKQSEEKLNDLLKEFNLTGLNEDQEQSSQIKGKGSSKDFWSNENDDNNGDTFGSNEVSADFFMDDDESDLKAKQNLEKLKKKLNLTELDEEEDIDEELKLKMAKKKSKILSKNTPKNTINQSNKLAKTDQVQNQDENEYSDNEYNNEDDDTNKLAQQVSIPQISFDIPVVVENDNNFFEDDNDDQKENKDLENDDVDNKLEELKKKLKLEIPKEEEDEEEKPKVKKSKILPKVKPPQIIIRPAQPKAQQQQTNTEVDSTSTITKKTENEKNINPESNRIEIPTISNEKDSFFSDENKNDDINSIQNESNNTAKATETTKIDNITLPSFDDAEIHNENQNTNIKADEIKDTNINEQSENNTSPILSNGKEEPTINIPTISDVTLPSFDNDDFFGDDDENDKEDKLPITKNDHEEETSNKITKKSKILPKKENSTIKSPIINETEMPPSEASTTKVTDKTNILNSSTTAETDSKHISNITLPSFGDDSNFFSDENKSENETKTKEAAFTLPTFDDDIKNESKIEGKDKIKPTLPTFDDDSDIISNNNAKDTKTKEASFTFPNFADDSNFFSSENKNKNENKEEEIKTKDIPSFPSIDDNSNSNKTENQNQQQPPQFPDITFPSFDDEGNFFSDKNEKKEEEIKPKENPTFPSLENTSNSTKTENQIQQQQQQQPPQFPDITFPSFDDDANFFSDKDKNENNNKEEKIKTKENTIIPSLGDNSNSTKTENQIQQQFPDITFPSFDEDANFFSDKNETETKTETKSKDESSLTLSSFDINIDADNSKTTNFFSDDENAIETKTIDQIKQENEIDENIETKKKKKSIILPKQTTTTTTTTNETSQISSSVPLSQTNKPDTLDDLLSNQNELNFDLGSNEKVENNDSFFTEKSSKSSNEPKITDLPPPPPIDFSSSFLSEKQNTQPSSSSILSPSTIEVQKNQNQDSDLDILNSIRRQEAERAEKARQNAALLASTSSSIEKAAESAISSVSVSAPIQAPSSSLAGDYEAFDDTPQTSTKERKHRKHRSHRHKSGKKGKTEESDGQNEGGEGQNDESYMSFD